MKMKLCGFSVSALVLLTATTLSAQGDPLPQGTPTGVATTASVVHVWGRSPSLGEFAKTKSAVDLTTAVLTQLGPLSTSQSLTSSWTGFRQESGTTGGLVLIFAGPEDGTDPAQVQSAVAAGLATGAKVAVLPAQPGMRLSDIYGIRHVLTSTGGDFVDLGSVAGGRPFEDALAEVARLITRPRSSQASGVAPDGSDSLEMTTPAPRAQTDQAARTRGSAPGPVTTELQDGERVIYMNPPPAVRGFPRTRPVPRDPSLQKMPALAN